ncbi:MFS general substrate transporter [Exidia glandulosa HHB12029]|uniref:MFS general substrate transporter n=1 Tax=Exidia glandulosa HHB12029 TaxID=1314781 RepID=A0A165NUN6_EXIGL|nr:MFS general substrate transporter [Exidia glandulosa HHB12029]
MDPPTRTDSSELEKQLDVDHVESSLRHDLDKDVDHGFTPAEQKALIRRIDIRLVVTVGALYCISLIDRTNMSAANIAGMGKELVLTGYRYNLANLVFFITYVVFQPPSTVLIRKIGPRIHLSLITLLWGGVMIGMGFVKNHQSLAGLRAVLGFLEAGFFPSCVYLLSTWYTRYEVGKRYSLFYILGSVAAGFAGILAYGIMQLGGREGISGWRWIFIFEGTITCAYAIACYWLLVDFPDSKRKTWAFLTQRELDWICDRITRDRGDSHTPPFNLRKFLGSGLDWKVWAYALLFFNTTTMTYALAYTLPLILVGSMGFTVGQAQCLVAPPYAFAGIILFLTGWTGDKLRLRGPIILFNMTLCVIGLPIMGWASSAAVRYFGVFLVTAGANSNIPAVMSFQANNVRGQWKRAFCSATMVGMGGVGGIAGSLVFREQDKATGYKPGMWACIACSLFNMILVLVCDLAFKRQNAKADKQGKLLEAHEEDASPDFRYTY